MPDNYLEKLWAVLLNVAEDRGHWREPGESEFDFLQRLIRRCPTEREIGEARASQAGE